MLWYWFRTLIHHRKERKGNTTARNGYRFPNDPIVGRNRCVVICDKGAFEHDHSPLGFYALVL